MIDISIAIKALLGLEILALGAGMLIAAWRQNHKVITEEPAAQEPEGPRNDFLVGILREAFRRASPNSTGRGSLDYLNLSTAIQKLDAGEAVPVGACVYLLEKIGAQDLADKIKEVGA